MSNLGEIFRLTIRDLKYDGWRTIITLLNLLVFFFCFFSLSALAQAGQKFGDQPTDESALLIMAKNVLDPSDSIVTDNELTPAIELIPEYVKSATPLVLKVIRVDEFLLQLRAARLTDMQQVHSLELIQGDWPAQPDEVLIGEGTAHLKGWHTGDLLHIYGSDFVISGVVRAPGTKFSSIWMNLEAAETLFNLQGTYQFAWIQLQPGSNAEFVQETLRNDARLRDRFEVYLADNLYQQYSEALKNLGGVSGIMVFLALLAVMLGTYGSVFLILSERNREITILRACGFTSHNIRALILLRTLLQLLAAYLFGYGLTALVLSVLNKINPLTLHSIPLPVIITGKLFLSGLLLATLFGLAGVWMSTMHLENKSVAQLINK